jgi:hypothetical protein
MRKGYGSRSVCVSVCICCYILVKNGAVRLFEDMLIVRTGMELECWTLNFIMIRAE